MNKLVYIFVPNEFVIGQVVLKSFIKRLAVAMVNKTVVCIALPRYYDVDPTTSVMQLDSILSTN
jgi:hypothetical protein